jgi:O-antigen/teichoic acid export membrane protein
VPGDGFGRNVAASVANAATQIAVALVTVPVVIHGLGLSGYGVWTLAQAGVVYVATAEAGLGPAVQRHAAVARGAGRAEQVAALLWSSLALYAVAGAVAVLACARLGAPFADLFGIPGGLRADAIEMITLLGPAIALALLAAGLGNIEQGTERFPAYAWSTAAGSVAFLAVLAWTAARGLSLADLARATIAQQAVVALARAWSLRDVWTRQRPRFVDRAEARALVGFSARLQATTLAAVVNNQTDKIVVGLVASTAAVGQVGIAAQVAEAGRIVAGSALSPMISRLSSQHGGGSGATGAAFTRLHRLWTLAVLGGTVVGLASLYPLIRGWLGTGHGDAAGYGALLVAAYGTNLLAGAVTAYLRALGRPGLEARAGLLIVALNVLLTVALGLAFGPYGVLAATTLAYAAGTAWFLRRAHGLLPGGSWDFLSPRIAVAALAAGLAAAAWGLAAVALLPTGVALAVVGAGSAGAFTAYLARVTGTRPSLRTLRALVA